MVGVAVALALDADAGDDIARFGDIDRIAVGRVHLEHARDVLALGAGAVEHAAALFELTTVNADVRQVAVLVADDFERQAAERLIGVGMQSEEVETEALLRKVRPTA